MQWPPLDVIQTWPTPNYIDPIRRGNGIGVVIVIFMTIAIVTVGIRIFARVHISRSFGTDDFLIILALIPAIAYAVIALFATLKYGCDRHVWDIPYDWAIINLKLTIAVLPMFSAASCLTKLAMLFLVRRMLSNSHGFLQKFIIATMVCCAINAIAFIFSVIFQCSPVSDYWTLTYTPQNCINETADFMASGIVNTVLDFVVVSIPIPVVWRLKMNMRLRLSIIFLFAVGFLICFAGVIRTVYTYYLTTDYDRTWNGYVVYLTGSIEIFVGITCASIPATKPFFMRYFPDLLSTISRSHSAGYTQTSAEGTRNDSVVERQIHRRVDSGMGSLSGVRNDEESYRSLELFESAKSGKSTKHLTK